jgi:hypothetical protein
MKSHECYLNRDNMHSSNIILNMYSARSLREKKDIVLVSLFLDKRTSSLGGSTILNREDGQHRRQSASFGQKQHMRILWRRFEQKHIALLGAFLSRGENFSL